MRDWHVDTIIVAGMMVALILIIIAADIIAIRSGDMKIVDLGKEIIIGLFGFVGGGATQSLLHKPKGQEEKDAK